MDKSVRFWNRFAESYAKRPIKDMAAYEKKLKVTRKYLSPNSMVMEFGCGSGSTALLHAPYVKSILAIDSSTRMIEISNRKKQEQGVGNVEFRTGTLFDRALANASFDAVLGLSVLHLVDDLDATVRKAWELLKPGGVFITSTVCLRDGPGLIRAMSLIFLLGGKLGVIPAVKAFDHEVLEESMIRAGFKILENLVPGDQMVRFIVVQK